ncbi:MAG TPA: GEVED domain-containing protein [Ferruginibacter sp.]|nr:GEVED domain-containing protein [Ferruginibacter sp.]HMP21968.1 GEVED domain-containing protein [Ferruginibacter sp.]
MQIFTCCTSLFESIIHRRILALLLLWVLCFRLAAQTTTVFTATGSAGSFITGSTDGSAKNDGNMVLLGSNSNRGWATFNLTTIPPGSVITAASVTFKTYGTTNSTAINEIHGFSGDPAVLDATALYNAIGALGTNVISDAASWFINSTVTRPVNSAGITFLQNSAGNSKVNIGFVRGSAVNYNIYGYAGDNGTGQPELSITYSAPAGAPGCATGLFPANGATLVPINGALTWFAASGATSYDVYFGTSVNPPLVATVATTTYPFAPSLATNSTYYYRIVPKNNAGEAVGCAVQSFTTSPLQVYCTPPATNCSQNDDIRNVTFGTLNNSSSFCNSAGYMDYAGLLPVPVLPIGQLQPISVQVGNGAGGFEYVGVWIDFNQDGVFDASEFTNVGFGNGSVVNGNINIPASTVIGLTKMRVRVRFGTPLTATDACTGYGTINNGETEDYLIRFTSCVFPVAGGISTDTTICAGGSARLYLKDAVLNNATSWRWYSTACGGTAVGTGDTIIVSPDASTSYFVRGEGGCVADAACSTVRVTVNKVPLPPLFFQASPVCRGGARALEVSGSLASGTFSSGTIAVSIPDNVATGASSNIAVTGIPAGVTITGIRVKLTMSHTYPGDMIINLKAPNGKILNLYKYNGGQYTGFDGEIPNSGWFDAEVNSFDTTSFYTVPSPYQYGLSPVPGPYKPDLINVNVSTNPVQNPNGFPADAEQFADLFSIPNGTWTLAMADGGPEDFGLLTNWSVTLEYILPKEFDVVWSPANTLYTDVAATIPYNGSTPLGRVYAKPDVTTTYTAIAVNGPCTSPGASSITLEVVQPVSNRLNPVDITICEGATARFGTAASGTSPLYQWQAAAPNGVFADITNGSSYAGVTTDTLQVRSASVGLNGYRYRCIIRSAAPCVLADTTSAAVLTVNPLPVVSLQASPGLKLHPGLTTTLNAVSASSITTYNWYRNNQPINASAGSYLVDIDNIGDYKVQVLDANGCQGTSAMLTIGDSVTNTLFVFPNPNTGRFQVRYHSIVGNVLPRLLLIYDAKGALVLNRQFTVTQSYGQMDVDLRVFGKGVYFINLLSNTGQRLATGRVVVL